MLLFKKIVRLFTLFLCCCFVVSAQDNNQLNTEVQLNVYSFRMTSLENPGTGFGNLKAGASIVRDISPQWAIKFSYQHWIFKDAFLGAKLTPPITSWPGQLNARGSYQLFDIALLRSLFFKKHQFYGGGGLSYAQGENTYIESVWVQPGFEDILFDITPKKLERYYGANAVMGYSYTIGSRVRVGLSARAKLFTNNLWEYDLGFNIGYRFKFF